MHTEEIWYNLHKGDIICVVHSGKKQPVYVGKKTIQTQHAQAIVFKE